MKVAIPRLQPQGGPPSGPPDLGNQPRVGQACKPCRQRKTKCNGEKPTCRRCQELRMHCYYEDGRRDRTKKQMRNMSTKIQDYEELLLDLKLRVSGQYATLIETTLEKHTIRESGSPFADMPLSPREGGAEGNEQLREPFASGSVRSSDTVDCVNEDFNRSERARATGYMGNNSDIAWIQRLRQEVDQGQRLQNRGSRDFSTHMPFHQASGLDIESSGAMATASDPQESFSVASMSYHLDDLAVSLPEAVEEYDIPPREVADMLLYGYFANVHPFFPIIAKTNFSAQYSLFFGKNPVPPSNRWLAMLNMVFALATKYYQLAHLDWQGKYKEHLVFFAQARKLCLDYDGIFSHPDLQQVQVEGLMSFYLLATGQINRSWKLCGMSVRSALALGLNLQSNSTLISDKAKEIRYRVWWALYTLEHFLSTMTGRPGCIVENMYTAPLPIPFEEESFQDDEPAHLLHNPHKRNAYIRMITTRLAKTSTPASHWMPSDPTLGTTTSPGQEPSEASLPAAITPNSSLFFLYTVDLILIVQEAINKLYAADVIGKSWTDIARTIASLNSESDTWLSKLPDVFNFTVWQGGNSFERERSSLAFLYCGTKISINRPCLCRTNRQAVHSQNSRDFSNNTAMMCVESARRMLDLIPDKPDAIRLYGISPWCSILHYLVQSTTVLLLELSLEMMHMPHEKFAIANTAKKAIFWLYHMSAESTAAYRAWILCDRVIRKLAPDIELDVSDLPPSASSSRPQHLAITLADTPGTMYATAQDASIPDLPDISPTAAYQRDVPSNSGFVEFLAFDPIVTRGYAGSIFGTLNDMDIELDDPNLS